MHQIDSSLPRVEMSVCKILCFKRTGNLQPEFICNVYVYTLANENISPDCPELLYFPPLIMRIFISGRSAPALAPTCCDGERRVVVVWPGVKGGIDPCFRHNSLVITHYIYIGF